MNRFIKMHLAAIVAIGVLSTGGAASADSVGKCTPVSVYQVNNDSTGKTNRVGVQCTSPVNDNGSNISYFEMPLTDAATANRYLSLASTAITAGRQLSIDYISGKNTDLGGNQFGCGPANCRFAAGAFLQ